MSESAIEQNTPSAIDELYSSLSDFTKRFVVWDCVLRNGCKITRKRDPG